jgi:RNA methyltransferase, TrmH family
MRTVSSAQNQAVRVFQALAAEPDASGTRLLLDGAHLVRDALASGMQFEIAAVAASRLTFETEERRLAEALEGRKVDVVVATDRVFDAMSPVRTPSGILAIVLREGADVAAICRRADGFILVAAGVQDPGNLGALVRVAEAGGVTGMLAGAIDGSGSANPFSWKALRGSMGSVLRLPVASVRAEPAIAALRQAGARIVAAVPGGGGDPDAIAWSGHVGLVLGGEGAGLPDSLVSACDTQVTVPMSPAVESLNVAVAGGILIYAARRHRQ